MKITNFIGIRRYSRYAIIITAVILGFATNANAQEKKVAFGLKGGINFCTVGARIGTSSVSNINPSAGFHAGVTLDVPVAPQIYLFTGAEYSVKGFVIDESTDTEVTASYVQVPLAVGIKMDMNNWGFYMNTGPYLAYGVGGKTTQGSTTTNTFSDSLLKNFDFGFVFGLGIDRNRWRFGCGSELGFLNILQDNGSDINMNNVNFVLSAGYRL